MEAARFSARLRDGLLDEAAQVLGLAQQVAGRLSDPGDAGRRVHGHQRHRLRYVGQVCPQPPAEGAVGGDSRRHAPAAQHDQVVTVLGVKLGQNAGGLLAAEAPLVARLAEALLKGRRTVTPSRQSSGESIRSVRTATSAPG